jgi:hypothetical protein
MPVRLQLSRHKGFDLQALSRSTNGLDAVNVARPFRWGNPWKIGDNIFEDGRYRRCDTLADCIKAFRQFVDWDPDGPWTVYEGSRLTCWGGYGPQHKNQKTIKAELRGKNLACWCKQGEPCHADVLLELANR